jgi:hypothetical protein
LGVFFDTRHAERSMGLRIAQHLSCWLSTICCDLTFPQGVFIIILLFLATPPSGETRGKLSAS